MSADKVKCCECGLLAFRVLDTHELIEVPRHYREHEFDAPAYDWRPACFVMAAALGREAEALAGSNPHHAFLPVITKERDCDKFEPWNQGFTPKEHKEMVNGRTLQKEIEERRLADAARYEEQRKADAAREDARDERQRLWQENQEKEREESRRQFDARWSIIYLIVSSGSGALVGVLSGIASAAAAAWFNHKP